MFPCIAVENTYMVGQALPVEGGKKIMGEIY
jgi:hypothetical protein